MNEMKFGMKIRQALNEATQLDAGISRHVAQRLRAGRERALLARKPESVPWLALAGNTLGTVGGLGGMPLRVLLPLALVIAGLFGIYGLQQEQRAAEAEEIDARLLTDDLPLEAYLDKGFEAWLKKRSAN